MTESSSLQKNKQNKRMYSITSNMKKYLNEINLNTDNIPRNSSSTERPKQIKTQTKTKTSNTA